MCAPRRRRWMWLFTIGLYFETTKVSVRFIPHPSLDRLWLAEMIINYFRKFRTSRPLFFARKWEEYVYQSSVNKMDFKIYGEYPPGIRDPPITVIRWPKLSGPSMLLQADPWISERDKISWILLGKYLECSVGQDTKGKLYQRLRIRRENDNLSLLVETG